MSQPESLHAGRSFNEEVQKFRDSFAKSKHILVVAGAGLSAASGIRTFRDGGGMWRSLDQTNLATPQAFSTNPSLVWQFYHYRRTKVLEAKPNAAHSILAKLSIPANVKEIAPNAESFHLITQNVDGLSTVALRALLPFTEATKKTRTFKSSIVEMHGRLFDVQCTECGFCKEDRSQAVCPALADADISLQTYHDAGSKSIDIPKRALPRCDKCGALARPGVVWFGERPHHIDDINLLVFKADMILVVGTSSTVRPASTFAYRVLRRGGKVAVFNLEPSEQDEKADFLFSGGCEITLPALFPELV